MEGGDGMVAVVRGLPDAGLAVTLLEGCRRYTLIPNSVPHPSMPSYVHVTRDVPVSMPTTEVCTEPAMRCDSSAQATDGQYASIYKMAHCNVSPTSPPAHLTEFPPQRTELNPGHGNFEVGGSGSGEKYSPVRQTTRFKGGMSWPDRGSVCAPRPSYEPDAFANSLRKYPNMSPQRSAEIVERLVNYTQTKHPVSKSPARNKMSPTRLSECNSSHILDKVSKVHPTWPRCYEPEVNIQLRVKTDESPTREGRPKRCDVPEINATNLGKNYEVRCLRDISKMTREDIRNPAGQNTTSVNMEIQAVVETMSREVATLPRVEPSKRNVAVPLSPISSITQRCPEPPPAASPTGSIFKSVQTNITNILLKTPKSVQATTSSIEFLNVVDKWQYDERSRRKSKSQEELRTRKDDFRKEMLQLLEGIDCHGDEVCQAFRDELVKKFRKNRRKVNLCIDGRAKSAPFWFKGNCRRYVDNCKRATKVDVFRAETRSVGVPSEDNLENAIREWLQEIHTKNIDFIEQNSLDQIVSSLAAKLRHTCLSSEEIPKSEIMKMIENMTFDASCSDRKHQLNDLAEALSDEIKNALHSSTRKFNKYGRREGHTKNKNTAYFPLKQLIQPTEEEVRGFVREELLVFMNKFHLKFNSRSIFDVETEVIDVLIDSIDKLQWGDNDKVKEEVAIVLRETSKMPEYYFTCLADALVKRFKSFMRAFNDLNLDKAERQTFVILQNTVQNTSIKPTESITEADAEAQIERYSSQLTQVIEAWWTSILGSNENEQGFREVAINDLAGDIVDRHRFLGMDTSKFSSNEEEVEYLKFQIFRWINKLVGDEAMQQALDRAPELMEQIQRIPVPVMRMPESIVRPRNVTERPRNPATLQNNNPRRAAPAKPRYNIAQLPTFGPVGRKPITSSRRMSEPAAYPSGEILSGPKLTQGRRHSFPVHTVSSRENFNTTIPSIPKITKDFTNYLKDWVDQIPIPENNSQEQDQAKKLRLVMYNGMCMAYVKAEMNPTKFRNEFYLQDFFDKELDELLSGLPSCQELTSKKQFLKSQLSKRATDAIKAIKEANISTSYRYRLCDAMTSILPPRPMVDDRNKSDAHLLEDFFKLNIAEDYLLFRLYLNMNRSKEDAYRNKVSISIQKLYDNAQLLPGNDRLPMNAEDFREKIAQCLVNVEIPTRDSMQDEADQIILCHEVAQWMQDLPISQSDAHFEQMQRRRLRESLAKKINEIEKQTNLCDNSAVRLMKNELSKFLEKFSPRPEEAENLSFLIDEFINRLKNRREKVERPIDFPMFFKHIPFSSSLVEHSGPIFIAESLEDDYAYLGQPRAADPRMLGAELVPKATPYKEPTDGQWLTLLNTQEQLKRQREAQALAAQPQQMPSCCQPAAVPIIRSQAGSGQLGQNQQIPYRDPSSSVGAQSQIPPCCQPAGSVAASQRRYSENGPGVVFPPVIGGDARSLHTSRIAGANYEPIVFPGRQVGAPAAAPSMHSEMRRLVDLQDGRLPMMQGAIPSARPGPSGITSFAQPPVPTASGILGTSQIAGPSRVARPLQAGPSDPCTRDTPMAHRSVRPRRIGSPQQVMSGGSPNNQSQFQFAAPLAQPEAVFATRHDLEEISQQNVSRPIHSPLDLSNQAPVGFSTPRQSLAGRVGAREGVDVGNIPGAPRVRRKRTREGEATRPDAARRRLDLDEVEEEEERERDEVQCRCTERVYRCRRRRPMCCDCEDMDYPRYYPMPYPYCFF